MAIETVNELERGLDGPDVATLPAALREPIAGVSFVAHLFVEAARLDGIAEGAVLAWLGVRPLSFARAEDAWNDRLDDELARDGADFDQRYQELLEGALSTWGRAILPLDEDVEAWVALQRHCLAADDPSSVLAQLGLTRGDELRLGARWRVRLCDPAVAARALSAMDGALPPLPTVTAAPLVFPPPAAVARPADPTAPEGSSKP